MSDVITLPITFLIKPPPLPSSIRTLFSGPAFAERLGGELDTAFAKASGGIFKTLRESQSYAFGKATLAQATGLRFASQLKAYRAAEEIYKRQQKSAILEEALKSVRKYVVVADPNDMQVFIVNFEEKLTPSLYDITGLQESGKK